MLHRNDNYIYYMDSCLDGGGIYNEGTLEIYNSNISGNFTDDAYDISGNGGGFYNSGEIIIENSTISRNSTGSSIFHHSGYGGGDYTGSRRWLHAPPTLGGGL